MKLFNERDYEEALKILTLLKELDKTYIHLWYYYEGIIYYAQGETTNDSDKKQAFYFNAEISFQQATPYKSKPKDTDFLLGRTLYKEGKLKEAIIVFEKYTPCPENEEEFQEILSRIEQQPNNSLSLSQLLPRENHFLSNSQLIYNKYNNNEDLARRVSQLEVIVDKHEQEIAKIKTILQSANIPLTADINEQITKLKGIDPKLEDYYKCFNIALHNVCIAASAVSSGLVIPDSGHLERVKASSFAKWVCVILAT